MPVLALVAVMTSAWLPCFACEGPNHGTAWPELASPASCHGAGDATASSCDPTIRAADSALNASALPPAGFAVQPSFGPSLLLPVASRPPGSRLARGTPFHARSLYLLHESFLA